MGNSRARAVYEANVPDNFRRPQTDSALESFIRAKYETKKYIAKEWVPTPAPVKVEWEKEMEEELEKQKKKKKIVNNSSTTATPIAIPAPSTGKKISSSSSNKSASALPPPASKSGNVNNLSSSEATTIDLLSLSSSATNEGGKSVTNPSKPPSDVFAAFLGTPLTTTTTAPVDSKIKPEVDTGGGGFSSLDKEEADFFNQTPASKEAAAKLTKDSILALYASAPAIPAINPMAFNNGHQQHFSGIPAAGGVFNSAPPSAAAFALPTTAGAQAFPNQQQFPLQGGATGWPTTQWTPAPGVMMAPAAQAFNFPTNPVAAAPPQSDSIAKQFGNLNLNNVWQ